MNRRILFAVALTSALVACGGSSAPVTTCLHGGAGCAALGATLTALNSATPGAPRPAFAASAVFDPATLPAWRAGSILSGPADELRVRVKRITTRGQKEGKEVEFAVFEAASPAGVEVALSSGAMDLAGAVGVNALSLPPGNYHGLALTLARVGLVRGCVSGTFMPAAAATGPVSATMLQGAPLHGSNIYSNDPIADGLPHQFCTSAAMSQLSAPTYSTQAIGSNAQFEAVTTAELTELDLAAGNSEGLSPEAVRAATISLSTEGDFTVTAGAANPLTLAVDLNRVLRYFANTRTDLQPPNPAMKAGTSYFFSTTFGWSTVLAIGPVIDFEGYETKVVVHQGGGDGVVPGWLTVALAGGKVLSGLVIPDDDNDLTVAKGNLDPALCSETAPGVWTLGYRIGSPGGQQVEGSFDGLTLGAVGSVTTAGVTPFPGSWLGGMTFDLVATRRL